MSHMIQYQTLLLLHVFGDSINSNSLISSNLPQLHACDKSKGFLETQRYITSFCIPMKC